MEANGKLIKILDTQTGTSKAGKEWSKKSFVIETDSKYNNEICFDLFGEEKIALLSQEIGSEIKVKYNLSSREYNGRYYTQAQAWFIESSSTPDAIPEHVVNELYSNSDDPF